MNNLTGEGSKEQLIVDFKAVVADAEALLKLTANQGGEKLAEVRARAEESLRIAKARMADTQASILLRTKAAARATDEFAHENPWQLVGVAAAACLVIGFLAVRR
jgi:ElaB/YqjD/DUF883 family membrane-anchored ribosome-binding protein